MIYGINIDLASNRIIIEVTNLGTLNIDLSVSQGTNL